VIRAKRRRFCDAQSRVWITSDFTLAPYTSIRNLPLLGSYASLRWADRMRSLFHHRLSEDSVIEPLPAVFPEVQGAELAAAVAGQRIAGDFYDSFRVSPERVLFGLMDLAGRREDNRTILAIAQQTFRSLGVELFSKLDINESDAMTELSLHINRELIEVSEGVHSCPAFIACYHERFGTVCYTNAGHTPGLLRDRNGIVELPSTGLPLGLFSHATLEAPTVGMAKGAGLLLVSRGVVECGSESHDPASEFGLERVKQAFCRASLDHARTLCESILDTAGRFSQGKVFCDDRTTLALVRSA
jgi:serine phosphatase RsbU (regulator of sigma subunit)